MTRDGNLTVARSVLEISIAIWNDTQVDESGLVNRLMHFIVWIGGDYRQIS